MSSLPATPAHERALATLEAADCALDAIIGVRLSLAPDRREATRLADLGRALLGEPAAAPVAESVATGLAAITAAVAENFPDNIFWDVDYLATVLVERGTPQAIETTVREVIALQDGFGHKTAIRFRYVHDFLYGFDWARWVRKDAEARAHVGPFDPAFLAYVDRRREELLELIAAGDRSYHPLTGDAHRNPFGFSREPADERRLHEALAADGLIPVQAWTRGGTRAWDRRYSYLRRQYAERLDIPVRDAQA